MSERSERDTYGGNTIENRGCFERAVDNAKSGICSLRSLDNEIQLGVVMCVWMVRYGLTPVNSETTAQLKPYSLDLSSEV